MFLLSRIHYIQMCSMSNNSSMKVSWSNKNSSLFCVDDVNQECVLNISPGNSHWTYYIVSHRSIFPSVTRHSCGGFCWALIAFCKNTKSFDLLDKVCNAGPPSKPNANHQNIHAQHDVHHIYSCPAGKKKWWLFHRTLQDHQHIKKQMNPETINFEQMYAMHVH